MAGHDPATDNCNNNGTKLEHVINSCFAFSKTKIVRAISVAGSRRPKSKNKEEPLVPIVFATTKMPGSKTEMLRALLDSGAGASLIAEKYCSHMETSHKDASFITVAGKFKTAGKVKVAFKLPELNPTAKIDYKFHVTPTLGLYDMIIGRDLLKKLGIILDHATETITWDDASIPMKSTSAHSKESFHIEDPPGIDDMIGRISGDRYKTILEAKYEKADLRKEVDDNCPQLTSKQRKN